jgi:hypothetical protein
LHRTSGETSMMEKDAALVLAAENGRVPVEP